MSIADSLGVNFYKIEIATKQQNQGRVSRVNPKHKPLLSVNPPQIASKYGITIPRRRPN
jgi:hypothetical protein